MQHPQTRLLSRARTLLWSNRGLFPLAPLASLVGLGALLDVVFTGVLSLMGLTHGNPQALGAAFDIFPALLVVSTSPLRLVGHLCLGAALLALAVWAQAALIHALWHKPRFRRTWRHAFQATAERLWDVLAIHLASLTVLLAVSWSALSLLTRLGTDASPWLVAVVYAGYVLAVLLVLTFKLLLLQTVAGARQPIEKAVHTVWQCIRRSWLGLIEFNLVLLVLNALLGFLLYLLATLVTLAIGTVVLALLTPLAPDLHAEYLFGALMGIELLLIAGCLTFCNMAAWSALVRHLEKRSLPARALAWLLTSRS